MVFVTKIRDKQSNIGNTRWSMDLPGGKNRVVSEQGDAMRSMDEQTRSKQHNVTFHLDTSEGTSINHLTDNPEIKQDTFTNNDLLHDQQRKEGKFKQAVRRRLGKDKLFHLVTTLLKSIEEEERAQNDLILSFQTARNIKIDIPNDSRRDADFKPKRRRKKMEILLAERIETKRKSEGELTLEDEVNAPVTDKIVGKMELTSNDFEKTAYNGSEDHESVKQDGGGTCFSKKQVGETCVISNDTSNETHTGNTKNDGDSVTEVEFAENNKKTIDGNKHRSVQRYALNSEKEVVVDHFRHTDENFDLKKLVLESVLENTVLTNGTNNKVNAEKKVIPETAICDASDIDESHVTKYEVVVETDGNDCESETDVKGTRDFLEDSFEISDSPSHSPNSNQLNAGTTDIEDFGKFLVSKQRVSSSEFSRMPSTLIKPSLTTISEAEHSVSSFRSLYGNSSDNIIEIEGNTAIMNKVNVPVHTFVPKKRQDEDHTKSSQKHQHKARFGKSVDVHDDIQRNGNIHVNDVPMKEGSRLLYIDLLDVYEGNKELQSINIDRSGKCKRSKGQTKYSAPLSISKERSYSKTTKSLQSCVPVSGKLPLFPKSRKPTKQNKSVCLHEESRTSPSDERIEQFRNYIGRKDSERYRNPDTLIWSHLRILETASPNSVSINTGGRKSVDVVDHKDRHSHANTQSVVRSSSSRKERSSRQYSIWNMPLHEAVKNIGRINSVKVPPAQALHDTRPRQQRVHQLYVDLRKDRAHNGYRQCRYLDLSPRI